MAKKTAALLPGTDALLRQFGERLRLARLRRRLSAKQVAERAGMAPMTLRGLERGGSGVTIGAYLAVMQVLGIEMDIDLLGAADPVGRELQDAQLNRSFASLSGDKMRKVRAATVPVRKAVDRPDAPIRKIKKLPKASEHARDWIKQSGFASADALADLIDPLALPNKKAR